MLFEPSWVEVDLGALDENIRALQEMLRPDTKIIFVVKADAYGHGAVPLARAALASGVQLFAVVHPHEALELRRALPEPRILMMGVADPADAPILLKERITPITVSIEHARALSASLVDAGETDVLDVHVKVDTGMGRLGVEWDRAHEMLAVVAELPGLNPVGLCSHFARVEPDDLDDADEQVARFKKVLSHPVVQGLNLFRHLSSSRAALYEEAWDLDGIRPGIVLYGYGTSDPRMRAHTRPLLQWKTRVIQVRSVPAGFSIGYYGTHKTFRPTDIGILSLGYADGYLRQLSNRGHVLVQGRRCPVVGRVSMNWIAVDLGPNSGVSFGEEAVLIGTQGNESIWADELAAKCKTIPYEILTNIDSRIPRRYLNAPVG